MNWYYYFYYKLYYFAKSLSDDPWNEWKPLMLITLLEFMLAGQGAIWYKIASKSTGYPNTTVLFLFSLSVVSFNYYIFLHRHKWRTHVASFKAFPKKKKLWGGIGVLLVAAALFAGLVFSFYRLSRIDWKNYNPNHSSWRYKIR